MAIQNMSSQLAMDVQGLERLKHTARQDEAAGLRGAAQQFEALFLQMMLKSMRDTIPSGGLLDSQQGDFYQSMLDQQWAQTMAGRGIGLADHLVAQLEKQLGVAPARSAVADAELSELIAGIPRGTPRVLKDALQPEPDGDKPMTEDRVAGQQGAAEPVALPAASSMSWKPYEAASWRRWTPSCRRRQAHRPAARIARRLRCGKLAPVCLRASTCSASWSDFRRPPRPPAGARACRPS